jgi:hypothetical protein
MTYDSWKTRSPDDELFRWLPYDDEPLDIDIVPCPACGGEGRNIYYGIADPARPAPAPARSRWSTSPAPSTTWSRNSWT